MLSKSLTLGGLQVGGPRTQQNTARFRVADNVYQTLDGYMIPRFHNGTKTNITTTDATVTAMVGGTRYKDLDFTLGINASNKYVPFYNGVKVPSVSVSPTFTYAGQLPGNGPQYTEKLGCLFTMFPGVGLFKYDGRQFYRAGVPNPTGYCQEYDAATPNVYVRAIQHHIDFQGNIVNSGYEDFSAKTTTSGTDQVIRVNLKGGISTNFGSEPLIGQKGNVALVNGYDSYFFRETSQSANLTTKELTITTGGDHNVIDGIYLITRATKSIISSLINGSYGHTEAVAYKVKRSTATTVVLDMSNVLALTEAYEWVSIDVTDVAIDIYGQGTFNGGTNYWVSFWTSTSPTANYVIKKILPVYYGSANSSNTVIAVNTATLPNTDYYEGAFNLSGNLGDIYDVTSSKSPFPWYDGFNPKSFTVYSDLNLGLIAYDSLIFYSDTTKGGAFEMIEGAGSIAVGSEENGVIQAVCANQDFILVSRQFKNYYVSGSLQTANYRTQEISKTSIGCYSNEGAIAVEDKILFINKHGVWSVSTGGRCDEVSANINGLFDNYSNTTVFAEEAYFSVDSYPTSAKATLDDKWIRVRYDAIRRLVAFVIVGDGTGTALILNMNNGEFYTWRGITAVFGTSPKFKDMFFIDGSYYATRNDASLIAINKEDKTSRTYMGTAYTPVLRTTWFTGGEPSLEKKINQIKLWGQIEGAATISHYIDWMEVKSTSADYTNALTGKFSHKMRLASANALSCSVEMVLNTSKFELEGLELEFQPFQDGMKK